MGKHVLCVTATGDGKSALFYMYSLVRPDTMTIVVSPTNALEADMVQTLERLGISAVAINRDALDADAVQRARHPDASTSTLWDDVESEKYNLVLLSPEMLESARFKACVDCPTVRQRLKLFCVDECHLIDEWGADFRVAYKNIAACIPWLPPSVTRLALTATLEPGHQTDVVTKALAFRPDNYYLDRRDCERRNVKIVIRALEYSYTMNDFRDLDWLVPAGIVSAADIAKTLIYCETIELGYRVAKYLRSLLPQSLQAQGKTIIRHVHSLNCPKCKAEVLKALYESGPTRSTAIFVSTDVLGVGMNVQDCDRVVCFPTPSSLASAVQRIGRTSRGRDRVGTAYIYIKKSDIEAVTAWLQTCELDSRLLSGSRQVRENMNTSRTMTLTKKVPVKVAAHIRSDAFIKNLSLWLVVAAFIRGQCIVRQINIIYQNSRVNEDCGRCSSCCVFPLPDPRPLPAPQSARITMSSTGTSPSPSTSLPSYKKLTVSDINDLTCALQDKAKELRRNSEYDPSHILLSHKTFLPQSYIKRITQDFLLISSRDVLQARMEGWKYWEKYGDALWQAVSELVADMNTMLEDRHEENKAQRRETARQKREEKQVRGQLEAAGLHTVKRVMLKLPRRPSTPPLPATPGKENIPTPQSTPTKTKVTLNCVTSPQERLSLSPRRPKRPSEEQESPRRKQRR